MTNIQAIDLLKGLEQSLDDYCELNDEGKTAFRMAITALELFGNSEQFPSAQPEHYDYSDIEPLWKSFAEENDINLTSTAKQLKGAMWCGYRKGKASAQPEIIRCKDCKYASPNGKYGCKAYHFKLYETHEMEADDFCSRAERRTDE